MEKVEILSTSSNVGMNHVSDLTKKEDDNEANNQSQEKVSAVKYVTKNFIISYLNDVNLVTVR